MARKHILLLLSLIFMVVIFIIASQKSMEGPTILGYTFRQIRNHSDFQKRANPRYSSLEKNYTGNIADIYFNGKKKPGNYNKTCAKFPDIIHLRFNNDLWQAQKTSNGSLHLFNAYIDKRNSTLVRILGTYDVYRPKETFRCQFWYNNTDKPIIVESDVPFWIFSPRWGADKDYFQHPYLITCPVLLHKDQLPVSVSLVEKPCDNPSNNLKIFHKEVEEKKNFVVCVKGLSFPFDDKSSRLTEWIELINLLGAEKINFYEFSVHPNVQKVLDYYVEQGFVEVTPLTLSGDFSNQPFLQNLFLRRGVIQRRLEEVIPFNDCLYKHLDEFKYVVLLDTDEVIVPFTGTWVELLDNVTKTYPNKSSYVARNVYFFDNEKHQHDWFDDVPRYMHMLQHVYRAEDYTKPGFFIKGFHDTSRVYALHNHFPFKCLRGCNHMEIALTLGHLQHYRGDCAGGTANCTSLKENSVLDTRIWNFKKELIERVERTLKNLDLL